jgi:hypothetical protein
VARLDNAMAGAGRFGLLPPRAAGIIDRIVSAVREWRGSFESSGVPVVVCDGVARAVRRAGEIGMQAGERRGGGGSD